MQGIWGILGIEPTTEEADIRRAYAAKLRVTNPEDDGEGFKALREAYEHAMNHARYTRMYGAPDEEADEAEAETQPEDGATAGAGESETIVYKYRPATPPPAYSPLPAQSSPPTMPAPEIVVAPHQAARQEHAALCERLAETLRTHASLADRNAALEAVLTSPALDNVDVYARTEDWLGNLLVSARPTSDVLFDRVIAFFGWNTNVDASRRYTIDRVLNAREKISSEQVVESMIKRFSQPSHEYYKAFMEVRKPPKERSFLNKLFSLRRTSRVMEFLHYTSGQPYFQNWMNPDAVAWWVKRAPMVNRIGKVFNRLAFMAAIAVALLLIPQVDRMLYPAKYTMLDQRERFEVLSRAEAEPTQWELRRTCALAVERLRYSPSPETQAAIVEAQASCSKFLEKAPDSLQVHQYAGIAALHARKARDAYDHFERILMGSPDDAYALFGRGLVKYASAEGADIADPKDLSDALALNPDVEPYFGKFRLRALDASPSPEKPDSRMPVHPPVRRDTQAEQIKDVPWPSDREMADHFGMSMRLVGDVVMNCIIHDDGVVSGCLIERESVPNIGLGEVALYMMRAARFKPATLDGNPVDRVPLRYTINFVPAPQK